MNITITNAKKAPSWETLQNLVAEVDDDPKGKFIRVERIGPVASYNLPGLYNLGFRRTSGQIITINLNIVSE